MPDTIRMTLSLVVGLAFVLLLAQAASAAAWLVERRRRRRAEVTQAAVLAAPFADLAILTPHGTIETCSDGWLRGREAGNPFVGVPVGERWPPEQAVHPDHLDALGRLRSALAGLADGSLREGVVEYTWAARGVQRWSAIKLHPLDRPGGAAIVAHTDVTAGKQSEAHARQALHELAHVNMRAGMGELVSAVTHELRQSLAVSLSSAQALKRLLTTQQVPRDEIVALLDDIADANREANDVIVRIGSLMRKEVAELRPVDLNAVVLDVVQALTSSAEKDGILLVADLDPTLPTVSGDPVQLRQLAMNLVQNAVQATRLATVPAPVVRVATTAWHGAALLLVDDAGPGVPEEALPRVFEPYFTTKAQGLGVGLSISRTIVESHGGSIGVSNLPQGGARFSVDLPAAV